MNKNIYLIVYDHCDYFMVELLNSKVYFIIGSVIVKIFFAKNIKIDFMVLLLLIRFLLYFLM